MTEQFRLTKALVAKSFGQAAMHYDDVAVLQRQTGDELLERLSLVKLSPKRILDLGAGTGRNLSQLAGRYPNAELVAIDIAPAMLQKAKLNFQKAMGFKRWLPKQKKPVLLVGDAESLPLTDNSVDLVFANLALQWCDLKSSFAEIERVLRPDGLLMFTSLGPDTLYELREAWASVDNYPHINIFYDMHDVGEAMVNAKLAEPVLDMDRYVLTYDTVKTLMKDLKILGASNVNNGRRRGLTSRLALKKVANYYEKYRDNKVLPASYEVIFGHAWGPIDSSQATDKDGTVHIPVSQIKGLGK